MLGKTLFHFDKQLLPLSVVESCQHPPAKGGVEGKNQLILS